ncbi:MAG TPA: RagB/SusD family nutrient uptake outer membrane protein [Chryseolinea sp.]|nr:RagB/SusD family nutrient uptake outer membrane protein [Chryseolinea sp.]
MKFRYIAFWSVGILLFSSCKKFLKEKPLTFLNTVTFYKNEADLNSALYALYQAQNTYYDGEAYAEMFWVIWELPSDQSYPNEGAGVSDNLKIDNYNFDPEIKYYDRWWRTAYKIISRSNDVIKNVPGMPISDEKKNLAIAEARFLRGQAYFELVMGWGDVPLVDETTVEFFPVRNSATEVYAFVIEDLKFASQYLPALWPDNEYGRATKFAAKSYLAKLYLTMAGFPIQDQSKYALAAQEAKEVVDQGPYSLYPDVADNWNPTVSPMEQIYIVDKTRAAGNGSYFDSYWAPRNKNELAAEAGVNLVGAFLPNEDFYAEYPDDDPRKKKFFMTEVTSFMDPSLTLTLDQVTVRKYWTPLYSNGNDQDLVRLRLAEILLIQAEAENEVNGPTTQAYDALNAVRSRAYGDASHNYAGLSKDQFREAVWLERALELCFEGVRWSDMVRTRKYKGSSVFDYINAAGVSPLEKNLLFPISTPEMSTNENLLQNPGY